MKPAKIQDVLTAVGGELINGSVEAEITGVSTDTRTTKPGDIFFALVGENMDGHQFVKTAFEKGAVAAVVSGPVEGQGTVIRVPDTLIALGDLAAWHRSRFNVRVVGVTGSVGKTSTKEMIYSILSKRFKVLKNEGNFNNEIGVPLTIFKLEPEHEILIQELAMRLPGEISRLAQITRPDIGVITNIGLSHIERLGSQEAIAEAKAELLQGLSDEGIAVLNADDPYYEFLASRLNGDAVSFGVTAGDIRAENIRIDESGRPMFTVVLGSTRFNVHLPVVGEHYISNALAAATVALSFGISVKDITAGLESFAQLDKRANVFQSEGGWTVFDDTYNAAPASVKSALKTISAMKGERKIAILGDMRELGEYSIPTHREVGQVAADLGIDMLITVGELGKQIAHGARDWGFKNPIREFESSDEVASVIRQEIKPGDVVLVKGSRAMEMERIVEALK